MPSHQSRPEHYPKRVLVIDDDPDMTALVGLVLKYEGYEVELAYDGRQGLQRFAASQPDVVLLDVMMPGMDGWSVLEHLRRVSAVPVVIITATRNTAEELMSQVRGAADYITKPFRPEDLTLRIARVAA